MQCISLYERIIIITIIIGTGFGYGNDYACTGHGDSMMQTHTLLHAHFGWCTEGAGVEKLVFLLSVHFVGSGLAIPMVPFFEDGAGKE